MDKTRIAVEKLVEDARNLLMETGYSDFTASAYLKAWENLKVYAKQKGVICYSTELFLAYVEEKFNMITDPKGTAYKKCQYRYLSRLDEYYKFGFFNTIRLDKRKIYCFEGSLRESIEAFLSHKLKVLSQARIQSYQLYLERFSYFVSNSLKIEVAAELRELHIVEFIERCKIYTKPTVYATISCLRQYFDYLHTEKVISLRLSSALPKVDRRKQKEIPSAYNREEIVKLLSCFNLTNPREIRDYAMVLIASRLGLRASDICSLKFKEIDWEWNLITVIQQKTQTPATYPLLNDIGEAIISYVQKVRPKIDSEFIFIRMVPPYTRMDNNSMYNLTEKYFTRAGINLPVGKSRGPHALRHSLSSMLLEDRVPMHVISEILIHKRLDTTKTYLKIAESQLADCALPVPIIEEESNHV
jgi:site-specific recombinase XerD